MATQERDEHLRQRLQERSELLTDEQRDSDFNQDAEKPSKPSSPFCIQNFAWLAVAIAVFYYSDFVNVMLYDLRIKRIWYWVGLILMTIHTCTAGFLVFWLGYVKKIDSNNWEKEYPKAIPIATASFLVGILCLSIALWPVWSLLAPIILLSLFMGVVVIVAMVG